MYSSPTLSLTNLDILPSTSSTSNVETTTDPKSGRRRTKGIVDLTSVDLDGKGDFRKGRRRVFKVDDISVVGKGYDAGNQTQPPTKQPFFAFKLEW